MNEGLFSLDASDFETYNRWCIKNLKYPCQPEEIEGFNREIITLKRELGDPFNFNFQIHLIDLLKDIREPVTYEFSFSPVEIELYGIYEPANSQIIYYQLYHEANTEIKQIVTIHERMHAFHHLNGLDFMIDNAVYIEFLAQLFTFRAVEGTYLEKHFKALSKRQPDIYQTWELGIQLTAGEVFDLFIHIRDIGKSDIPFLDCLAEEYDTNRVNVLLSELVSENF